jgi:polar amino acid transport system substrate-binding protein
MRAALLALALALAGATAAAAPPLRWASDSEGGAPFCFQDPADPSRLVGCEVDLMDALCQKLGRPSAFVQNTWDGLIPGLQRGNYDVAINAIEITPERQRVVSFSDPYYVTFEQFVVPDSDNTIKSLQDLKGLKVGTYKGAVAQDILEKQGGMELRLYEMVEPMYRDLLNGRLDATLLDHPLALYCGQPIPGLKFVGKPVSQIEYGIALAKKDAALLAQINQALDGLKRSGKLREIFERWNLWTPMMAAWLHDPGPQRAQPEAWDEYLAARNRTRGWREKLADYIRYLPLLAQGALVTLELSVLGMALAIALGLVLALAKLYAPPPFNWAAHAYIELFRGTPLLIQLFIIFYGLPYFGIKLPPFAAAILGLGLNYAAYEAENYRAGIMSVPRAQTEAAFSLGFSRMQALRHVVLPQALRVTLPPVTNDFISIIKDSSLVSVITMVELTKVYGQLASATYDWMGLGLLTAAMYFLVGFPFVLIARKAEKIFNPKPF